MEPRPSDYRHLVRMAGLFVVGISTFLVLRSVFVPKDYGLFGPFNPGALQQNMDHPIKFAGQATCVVCHTEQADLRAKGRHANVACESCHGALAVHAQAQTDGKTSAKPQRPDPRQTCVVCHTASISKPKAFPQVDPAEHAPEGPCTACHVQPHNPKIA
ncbi:MAG: multiheme c-type cytochrome [Acidobacteriota bacterium]